MNTELTEKEFKTVGKVSALVDYDIYTAAAFAIELLTDVNFHDAAKVLREYVEKEGN